ncbi:MAG: DUF4878 domain-containing protein [Prevotella sp.]|nr:DUF4878 domain-containing protein [Prevotella sp.]
MKKLFVAFSLAFMMLAVMSSCGSSTSSPSEVALAATKCMQDKDFSGYVDLTDTDSDSKEMMVSMIGEKATQQVDSKGGITSFDVQSEEIADDGKTAVVKMNIAYGNGDTEVKDIKCVNKDGKWLVSKDK